MRHVADGTGLPYDAHWEALTLTDASGTDNTTMSATTYTAAASSAPRPVMFLFNGGPGASSSPLHMSAFGPRRIVTDPVSGERAIHANPYSLLDQADLVFVDPVGTGFNRVLREGGDTPYLSVHGDAAAMEHFVRHWLTTHDRLTSPLYLVGESFGGFRLATMCESISDLNVAGLALISPMLDASAAAAAPGNDLPHVFDLPPMAVAAWHHGRSSGRFADAAAVFANAQIGRAHV